MTDPKKIEINITPTEVRLLEICIKHSIDSTLKNLHKAKNTFEIANIVFELEALKEKLQAFKAEGIAKDALEKAKHD